MTELILNQGICQCKGCDLPVRCMGMCNKHWMRTRKFGSPFVTQNHVLRGLSAEKRFELQYRKVGECWEWIGTLEKDGYGVFHAVVLGVAYQRAHRFSWAHHTQSRIPKGMLVCHSCDNPRCVNPAHLWLGTYADNHEDMVAKGRRRTEAKGEMAHKAKLTEDQVKLILVDPRPYSQIATEYGVAGPTITSIKNRESWRHVEVDQIVKNGRGGPGRRGKGEKLTEELVREIRTSSEMGKDIAKRLGISKAMVTAIRKRQRWAHVTD
jgi:hypothetical protein